VQLGQDALFHAHGLGRALPGDRARPRFEDREIVGVDAFVPSLAFYSGDSIRLSSATLAPLTSRSMLHFAGEIARQRPESWSPAGWWMSTLEDGSDRYVYIVKPGRRREIERLERAGLSRLFVGPKIVAYGRPGVGRVASAPLLADRGGLERGFGRRGRGGEPRQEGGR